MARLIKPVTTTRKDDPSVLESLPTGVIAGCEPVPVVLRNDFGTKQKGFALSRTLSQEGRTGKLLLAALVLVAAFLGDIISFLWFPSPGFWASLLTDLDYIAIVYVALNFGAKGGLVAAVVAGITHGTVEQVSGRPVAQQGEFAIFLLVGILAGLLESVHARKLLGMKSSLAENAGGRLIRIDRTTAVGQVSPMLIHELRTPLSAIQGAGSVLADAALTHDNHQESLAIIARECQRLSLLVDLLDFDNARASEFFNVDVVSLFDEIIKQKAHPDDPNTARLRRECPEGLPPLRCNRKLITNALLSVTANGLQAMKRGGEIVLSASSTKDTLSLEIRDQRFSGERANAPRAATYSDTGLAIVREIVARHGGTLRIVRNNLGVSVLMSFPRDPELAV